MVGRARELQCGRVAMPLLKRTDTAGPPVGNDAVGTADDAALKTSSPIVVDEAMAAAGARLAAAAGRARSVAPCVTITTWDRSMTWIAAPLSRRTSWFPAVAGATIIVSHNVCVCVCGCVCGCGRVRVRVRVRVCDVVPSHQ